MHTHDHQEKGNTVKSTEHITSSASTPKTGLFATLAAFLRGRGSSAPTVGAGLAACVTTLAALTFTAAPALAAAPEAPTLELTSRSAEAVSLRGVLSPNRVNEAGTYEVLYKKSASECTGGSHGTQGLALEVQGQEAPETISGLEPGTKYTFCVRDESTATHEHASSTPPLTVTTAIKQETPVNEKVKAGSITATTAEVEGQLNPGKERKAEPGSYEFIYKISALAAAPTGECEESRAPEPAATASGGLKEGVGPVKLEHLEPNAKYTLCLRGHDEAGEEATGAPVTFNTLPAPPTILSESASHHNNAGEPLNTGEARLEGVLNPNNQVTECHFQDGEKLLSEYDAQELAEKTVACEPELLKAFGEDGVAATIGGLSGAPYHYRIVAKNGKGEEATGAEQTVLPPEAPEAATPGGVTESAATLHGVLNPHSQRASEPGSAEFVYRESPTECRGEGEKQAGDETTPGGAEGEAAEATVTELLSGTKYTFCVRVVNDAGEEALSAPETFTTVAVAPTIVGESESVMEVTATGAKLHAEIEPGGPETTYHFEYDTSPYTGSAAHGNSTPESAPLESDGESAATAAIQRLEPGTEYHYRVVAHNPAGGAGGSVADGPDRTFTTQATGEGFALPDGRGYELVSPAQMDGAEALGIGGGGLTPGAGDATQASEDGTSVTYITTAPVGANPPASLLSTQLLSTRSVGASSSGGWSSQDISPPHEHAIGSDRFLSSGEQFLRFSSDLSRAVLVPLHDTPEPSLAPEEVKQEVSGETEIYLRNNLTNAFQALVTVEPLTEVTFEGATPDLEHVAFGGAAGLDPSYRSAGGLYEWADGHTQLASVLPSGKPASGLALLGSAARNGVGEPLISATRHAISDDGTRVVWNAEGDLFTRDMTAGETLQVDAAQGGAGAGGGVFQAANSDGTRVFFTDGSELISGASAGDLYMFQPTRPQKERLTDLMLGVAGVHVLEANEAGTSIYINTPGVLTSGPNSEGEVAKPCSEGACNVYLLRETPAGSGSWSTTFIAGGLEEGPSEGLELRAKAPLARQTARVSPNGDFLAFMSKESLTGYDNVDVSEQPPTTEEEEEKEENGENPKTRVLHHDEEVFEYDAATNHLVCASCDPTGARPVGQRDPSGPEGRVIAMDPQTAWKGRWLAAAIPGWTEDGGYRSTGYQPRYLTDSGRLFFNSAAALVPRDVNGREDVYEYEPERVGDCTSAISSASNVYVKEVDGRPVGGCVGLISAGTGGGDSAFFDASATGNDVFFTTNDELVPEDHEGESAMYDARVCTETEPCPPSLAVSPPCSTTDSCRAAPSPQPGVFAAPASATFTGAGNPVASPTVSKATVKTLTRAQRLAAALRSCRKKPKRARGACEKSARKRYGAKAKTKTKAKHTTRRAGR